MDRQILYPAQIPLVEDGLNAQRNAMVGLGHLAGAAFGTNTVAASGFACSPGEGLAVTIAPGALLAPGVVDASAYGTLAAVSSALVRQFISRDPVSLTVPGAGATYVVYVTPQTVDADDTVLPFYNAADPSVTYAGQNNSGLAAPTVRRDEAVLAIGSSVPSGAYPLWQIVVPAGATTLTADMLSTASGAPFYPSLAAVASRIIAPFNAQLAVAMGGYPVNAVVAAPDSPGTFWVSTTDANVSAPGADGATWQSLFDGYATEAWANSAFVKNNGIQQATIDVGLGVPSFMDADGAWHRVQPVGDYATNTALQAEASRAESAETSLNSAMMHRVGDIATGSFGAISASKGPDGRTQSPWWYCRYAPANGSDLRQASFMLTEVAKDTPGNDCAAIELDDDSGIVHEWQFRKDNRIYSQGGVFAYTSELPVPAGNKIQSFHAVCGAAGDNTIPFPVGFSAAPTTVVATPAVSPQNTVLGVAITSYDWASVVVRTQVANLTVYIMANGAQ